MSSPSRFAGSITVSFIGRVMRPPGGSSSTSIHFQSHSGFGSIVRPIASTPGGIRRPSALVVFEVKYQDFVAPAPADSLVFPLDDVIDVHANVAAIEQPTVFSQFTSLVSGLLSSARSRRHRPKPAASPRWSVAKSNTSRRRGQPRGRMGREGEAAMTEATETSKRHPNPGRNAKLRNPTNLPRILTPRTSDRATGH
jgi:hypothetical protein